MDTIKKFLWLYVQINKKDLLLDLLKKIKMAEYFHYVAGCDTFDFNKPDPDI